MKIGQRVRVVEANGCMAHRRENLREGLVCEIVDKKVYGASDAEPYAIIRLDSGDVIQLPANHSLWNMHDDLLEYAQ